MNKCENCGFLHYRTDPCRAAKKPDITAGPGAPDTGVAVHHAASRGPGEENGAITSKPKRPGNRHRPGYFTEYMRVYRARIKAAK